MYGLGPLVLMPFLTGWDKLRWFHFVAMALEHISRLATAQVGSSAIYLISCHLEWSCRLGLTKCWLAYLSFPDLWPHCWGVYSDPCLYPKTNWKVSEFMTFMCLWFWYHIYTSISFTFIPFWGTLGCVHGDGTAVWYGVLASYGVITMPGGERWKM